MESNPPTILTFLQTLNQHFDLIFLKHALVQMFYENDLKKKKNYSEKTVFVSL